MPQDTVDRRFVSRYSQPGFGLQVYQAGVLGDADAPPTVSLLPDGTTTPEWTATAAHDSLGVYSVLIPSTVTAVPHLATLMWDYSVAGCRRPTASTSRWVRPLRPTTRCL